MIMIVKTSGSQMGCPAAAEEGGEAMGGGRGESGERSEVCARSSLTTTAPKANQNNQIGGKRLLHLAFNINLPDPINHVYSIPGK